MDIPGLIFAILFFLTGIIFTILPTLPGSILVWTGMLVYGLFTGFDNLPLWFFVVQGLLGLAVMGIDYLASALGNRYFGGSKQAFWGALVGMIAGLIIFNLPGMLGGIFLGSFLAELGVRKDPLQSVRAGMGALLGFLGGIPLKIVLEIIMIIWFVLRIVMD